MLDVMMKCEASLKFDVDVRDFVEARGVMDVFKDYVKVLMV